MFRRLALLAGLILAVGFSALPAHAQDQVQIFGGYSYMHMDDAPAATNLNGWEISGEYKFAPWVGGVADFDGHYGGGVDTHTFLFGPQVSWPARVSPFAHLLLGGAHTSFEGFGNTSFSLALGAGIDTEIIHGLYWRVFQADYIPTYFFNQTQHNVRISTGIVIHF